MLRKSGLLAVLLALGIVTLLSASTSTAPTGSADPAVVQSLLPAESAGTASCAASPLLVIGDMGRHYLDTCIPYGNVCDPRYVQDPVCCPGTHCQYLYPGVPLYCL